MPKFISVPDRPSSSRGRGVRRLRWAGLAGLASVVVGLTASAGELRLPAAGDDVVPGRFLVVLRPASRDVRGAGGSLVAASSEQAARSVAAASGHDAAVVGDGLGVLVLDVSSVGASADADETIRKAGGRADDPPGAGLTAEAIATLEAVAALPEVEAVEPDYRRHLSEYTPSDPLVGQNYFYRSISAPQAFRGQPSGNPPVVVAVLDDGLYWDHPDLAGRLWRNVDEIYGNGVDDDRNGYVDDTYGYDFAGRDAMPYPDFALDKAAWESHGTHIAGLIAANWDNGIGLAGICPNVQIMPCKFFGNGPLGGSVSGVVEGINYAVNNGARLINCSFGGSGRSLTEERAIQYAQSRGVLLVCAAGNESSDLEQSPVYPAAFGYDNIITVAASDSSDNLASFSNFGVTSVDLAAPGRSIISTIVTGPSSVPQAGYQSWNGTSMATPLVVGALALALDQDPSRSYLDLRYALFRSVDKVPQFLGRVATGGRLNVATLVGVVDPARVASYSAAYSREAYTQAYYGYSYAYYAYAGENFSASASYAYVYAYYGYLYAYHADQHGASVGRDATYLGAYRYYQATCSYYAYLNASAAYREVAGVASYWSALLNYYAFVYGYSDLELYN